MAKSFRRDPELGNQLEEAARIEGGHSPALIRDALRDYCREGLSRDSQAQLRDVIGAVETSGGRANWTGRAFTERLMRREP